MSSTGQPHQIQHYGTDGLPSLERYWYMVLRRQHAYGMRSYPPLWYWRFQQNESFYSDLYRNQPQASREYRDPIPLLAYVDHKKWNRRHFKAATEEQWEGIEIVFTEAERLRLAEAIVGEDQYEQWSSFRLTPGDLFAFDGRLFQIESFNSDSYWGPSRYIAVWRCGCSKFRYDSTQGADIFIPESEPKVTQWPKFLPE